MPTLIDTDEAYRKCQALADSHYENFPVAKMLPAKLRKHVAAIYAFARTADDIADEEHETIAADSPLRVEKLRRFESQLLADSPEDLDPQWAWIFVAVADTVKKFDIPVQLLRDLVDAFAQDVAKKRYDDFPQLLDYCRRSANPVGRLVLILHGIRSDELFKYSDDICSALQLANFWQDMSVDKDKNRIYVPKSDWRGADEAEIFAASATERVRGIVRFECERTEKMFASGERLIKHLPFPLRLEIKLTVAGGRAILSKIASQNYDTLAKRPALGTFDKIKLLLAALF